MPRASAQMLSPGRRPIRVGDCPLALAVAVWALFWALPASAAKPAEKDRAGWARMTAERGGFVIWESNRSGAWRLWRRELDGSNLRRITPDEEGREHYCPHISPDGAWVFYLSYPQGQNTYKGAKKDAICPAYVIAADGSGKPRRIADNARSYYEDRGAVWLGPEELIYLDGPEAMPTRLNLRTGRTVSMGDHSQFLMDPTLRYATTGQPTFSRYNAEARKVKKRRELKGCQPYFTRDGQWGFWMGGAGGPINRFHLATGKASVMLGKHDKRMPRRRSYLYFPMISPCGELLTFAASPNQHDHFKSDYDIFVTVIDPKTLEVQEAPVRYSFDRACDRFPDVYRRRFQLGRFDGECPFTLELEAPEAEQDWTWEFSDGTEGQGATIKKTFARPGTYRVRARRGDRTLLGYVAARPPRRPEVAEARFLGPRRIEVLFDEPVRAIRPYLKVLPPHEVVDHALGESGRHLVVALNRPAPRGLKLRVAGFADRAQKPNLLKAVTLELPPPPWPAVRKDLLFLFATHDAENRLGEDGKAGPTCEVQPRGLARFTRHHAMRLDGGSFLAPETGRRLRDACVRTDSFTLEATFRPGRADDKAVGYIVRTQADPAQPNFALSQNGEKLLFGLATSAGDAAQALPSDEIEMGEELFDLEVDKPSAPSARMQLQIATLQAGRTYHLAVTYEPGRLVACLDGNEVLNTDKAQGKLDNWSPQDLLFGGGPGLRHWNGELEGVAVYSRALSQKDIRRHGRAYAHRRAGRKPLPPLQVRAKVLAASPMPTLRSIRPYRRGLVVLKYRVEKVIEGKLDEKVIKVARWAILGGKELPIREVRPGAEHVLTLEPFSAQPQLEALYSSDAFLDAEDLDRPTYFATEPPPEEEP